jgi:5-methylcytosine-specific restriction enzyme A
LESAARFSGPSTTGAGQERKADREFGLAFAFHGLALRFYKSPPSNPYRWYNDSRRWKTRSKRQLREFPFCKFCADVGNVTRAEVADHVIPHKGDWNAFLTGELQSLCKPCHDNVKTRVERLGYRPNIGTDGLPIDPNHPVYDHSPGKRPSNSKSNPSSVVPEI